MHKSRNDILVDILQILNELADDWEYDDDITQETLLISDMGFASLDVVILANTAQQRFGQVFPFPEFFAEIGQRENRDVSVGEWVDFISQHMNSSDH